MKVFITRTIPEIGIQLLQDAGLTVIQWKEKRNLTPQELIDNCKHCDALMKVGAIKIDSGFLEASRHLKVISLLSVGFDGVDLASATRLKIPVGNTPGVLNEATATAAFLLMIATSRKAFYMHKKIIRGEWGFFEPTADLGIELEGKTLGIWGLGRIGFEMAKKCVGAFNMKVIYTNRSKNEMAEKELHATQVSFDELLRLSDVLSVHTALTPETTGKMNKEAFNKMKPTSIFINAARGGIHNEKDLIEALQNKTIWGAGLDVTNPEPMEKDNALLNMPNACVLPHIGSATQQARDGMARIAAENIIAALRGERLKHVVNPEVYG